MKLLIENWRKYLNEAQELESGFGLILKVDPPTNVDKMISVGQQKYSNILPGGEQFTKINKFHVTLISGKAYKPLSNEQKESIVQGLKGTLPEAIIDTSQVFLAAREMEGRKTLYLKIQNSADLNQAINQVFPEHQEKYMHLSIANVHGGDSFKSVGDINQTDEGEEKNIVPAAQQQQKKKKAAKQQRKGPQMPAELRALGGTLRQHMRTVATIWDELQAGTKTRDDLIALGLSDEQADAVMGVL